MALVSATRVLAGALLLDGEAPVLAWRQALRATWVAAWLLGPDAPAGSRLARASTGGELVACLDAAIAPFAEPDHPAQLPGHAARAFAEAQAPWRAALPRDLSAEALADALAPALQPATTWPDQSAARYATNRKQKGTYYTPTPLIEALLEELEAKRTTPTNHAKRSSINEPPTTNHARARRVIDPACGTGALLRAVLRREGAAVFEGLHGVDLDPLAVELCRLSLFSELARMAPEAASGDAARGLRERIRCGNALVGAPPPGVVSAVPMPPPPPACRPLDWPGAFAQVWRPADGRAPGFDRVVVNPPWERLKVQARELLRSALPEAAAAAHRAERERTIARRAPHLAGELARQRAVARELSDWLRGCGAFACSAHGDLNTFALFVERAWQLTAHGGRAGLVVPSGLVTDHGHRRLFAALLEQDAIAAVLDFENRARHFPDVDSRFRFALVAMHRRDRTNRSDTSDPPSIPRIATQLVEPDERHEPARTWSITAAQIAACNPHSRTLPMFRSARSAQRGLAMHATATVLGTPHETGGWGIELHRMFDMTNHASDFHDRDTLEAAGLTLQEAPRHGLVMARPDGRDRHLPLIEGKLFWQHDAAHATFAGQDPDARRKGRTAPTTHDKRTTTTNHAKRTTNHEPRFWVREGRIEERAPRPPGAAGFWLCIRALTNPTNQRTLVAALVPPSAVGNSALLIEAPALARDLAARRHWLPLLCANLDALVLDDLARQKMGNTNVNMYMLRQLPVLSPAAWQRPLLPDGPPLAALVAPRALALAACHRPLAWLADAPSWGREVPHLTSPDDRERTKAELDALIAHAYGLDEAALRNILEPPRPEVSFGALRRRELAEHGRFVTAERVLDAFATLHTWAE